LRSMQQAIYSPENKGHFGLALEQYAHFTSPIRRYPDLILHRAIKAKLKQLNGASTALAGALSYPEEQLDELGVHCSMTERRADDATRQVDEWLKCEYMQDHVGSEFTGVIAAVTNFGLFVRIDDMQIDGLVHISNLDNDYYQFDSDRHLLIGENSGKAYRLGDKARIRVRSVNLDERKIDLELLSAETPAGNQRQASDYALPQRKRSKQGKAANAQQQRGPKSSSKPSAKNRAKSAGKKKPRPSSKKRKS
ncbi:MAG TPA: RNB domain-containing ribonuclease, partial [Pseudidiomarina sp.]|nr:RNB domain-containing ribonuclease [Pseudidiomarina sp.]